MNDNVQNQDLLARMTCVFYAVLKKWTMILFVVLLFGFALDSYRQFKYVPYYGTTVSATLGAEENTFSEIEKMRLYIPTLSYLFNSRSAKDYVCDKMNIDHTTVRTTIDNTEANIVYITVSARTRKEAYYGMKYLLKWYKSSGKAFAFPYKVTVMERGNLSLSPVNLVNHRYNLVRGGLLGGLLMTGLLSLYYLFRMTVKTPNDVKKNLQKRLYVSLPRERKRRGLLFWRRSKKPLLISSFKTSFMYKEAVNKLRNRVEQSVSHHGYKAIMVTSSVENEGKSTVTVNLAIALAKNKHRVLLIDGDLKKPALYKIFDVKKRDVIQSLNNYLKGEGEWKEQITNIGQDNLDIILALPEGKRSNTLLSTELFKVMIEEAKKSYDYVIIDTSPSYDVDDAVVINEHMDACLMVVKQDVAVVEVINDTLNRLTTVKENVLGIVFNKSVPDYFSMGQSGYANRYGYGRYNQSRRRG